MSDTGYYDEDDQSVVQQAVVSSKTTPNHPQLTLTDPRDHAPPHLDLPHRGEDLPLHHPLRHDLDPPPHRLIHRLRILLLQLHPADQP